MVSVKLKLGPTTELHDHACQPPRKTIDRNSTTCRRLQSSGARPCGVSSTFGACDRSGHTTFHGVALIGDDCSEELDFGFGSLYQYRAPLTERRFKLAPHPSSSSPPSDAYLQLSRNRKADIKGEPLIDTPPTPAIHK
jgi:hypothetical protein